MCRCRIEGISDGPLERQSRRHQRRRGGIGAATARLFCAEQAKVLLGRFPMRSQLTAKVDAIRKISTDFECDGFVADVAREDDAEAAIARALTTFGTVDAA